MDMFRLKLSEQENVIVEATELYRTNEEAYFVNREEEKEY